MEDASAEYERLLGVYGCRGYEVVVLPEDSVDLHADPIQDCLHQPQFIESPWRLKQ